MSLALKKIDFPKYNNADHVEFHETLYKILYKERNVIDAEALLAAYQAKIKQEIDIYGWLRRSEFTRKKAEIDRQRGKMYGNLVAMIRMQTKDFDPAIKDHARRLAIVVHEYGRLQRVNYDAETAGIDSVVETLNSEKFLPSVEALELTRRVNELSRLNGIFKELADGTREELMAKPPLSMKKGRRETDLAMRAIADRIGALIVLNGEAGFFDLVNAFNVHAEHYNTLVDEHYGRLHAKTDINAAMIDRIETQRYTGKRVYVIPNVWMRQKGSEEPPVELVFNEDFTVYYRNNVGPGSAAITVSGIGKYTGHFITTFNIEQIPE